MSAVQSRPASKVRLVEVLARPACSPPPGRGCGALVLGRADPRLDFVPPAWRTRQAEPNIPRSAPGRNRASDTRFSGHGPWRPTHETDEMRGCSVDVGTPWCSESVVWWDVGAAGTLNCCREHETQTLPPGAPPGDDHDRSTGEEGRMDRLIERSAGLELHKDTVAACVRVPAQGGRRTPGDPHLPHHHRRAHHPWGLAGELRGHGGGDGVHRGLLAPRLLPARRRLRVLVAERPALAQRPGAQDRRRRRRLDLPARRARAGPSELRAAAGDPRAPGPHPVPHGADPGARPEAQRLEKILQDAGIKLSSVASQVLGASGRAMLTALVQGTHDPGVLAELAKGVLRQKIPALQEALQAGSARTTLSWSGRSWPTSTTWTKPSVGSAPRWGG
jgi:hypothetical protein